jgi:hypothetical protein
MLIGTKSLEHGMLVLVDWCLPTVWNINHGGLAIPLLLCGNDLGDRDAIISAYHDRYCRPLITSKCRGSPQYNLISI